MNDIKKHLSKLLYGVTLAFLSLLIIFYLIIGVVQYFITFPITKLVEVASEVTQGNYAVRAQKLSEDEIGILTDAFNSMLQAIHARDEELNKTNANLEAIVEERTKNLEHALKVKDMFLSNMNHEIRTPIHGVKNFLHILARDWKELDEGDRYALAKKADIASDRLLLLINNLLDMSKLEEGAMHFNMQPNKVSKLVDQLILETEGMRNAKKMELQFDRIPADQEPEVECDEGRISQVITNLIGNAIKYSPGGQITIKQYVTDVDLPGSSAIVPGMAIAFSDEGVGIPEDELTSIFDKFNESSRTKTGAGGTGLGLAICREIILSHIGRIWAENNPSGKGSTFTFLIPLQVPPGVTRQTKEFL